jgi:photosystem II stability/assembly factor-like uncharacterized protein
VVVVGSIVLAVAYGPRSTDTGTGVTGRPTDTTWTVAAADQWSREFAPGNIANFGVPDTITCPAGSVSTCFVTASSISTGFSALTSAAYRTTDSGSTWQKLTLPAYSWLSSKFTCSGPLTCEVGADIQFPPTGTPDFTGQGAMLSTDDGGRRWTVHDLPSAFGLVTDLSCPTRTHCVAFAWLRGDDPLPNYASGAERYDPTAVLTTTDGGRTWSRASLPPASSPLVRYALGSYVGGSLTCPTVTVCDATGEQAELVTTSDGYVQRDQRSVALVSSDAGRSWTTTHQTDIVGLSSLSISCVGGSTCWMLEDPGPGVTNPDEVFASDDGGRRWSPLSSTGLPRPDEGVPDSITCSSIHECFLPDDGSDATNQTILTTNDGGHQWLSEALPPPSTGEISRSVAGLSCSVSGSCLALVDELLAAPSFTVVNEVLTNLPRPTG